MRKVVVHPDYPHLEEYVREIPERFHALGKIIHKDRNILRRDEAADTALVIKSYGRIYLPNRIRYTYFYPSKAQRAFDYAGLLLQNGFGTPRPIAYNSIYRMLFKGTPCRELFRQRVYRLPAVEDYPDTLVLRPGGVVGRVGDIHVPPTSIPYLSR